MEKHATIQVQSLKLNLTELNLIMKRRKKKVIDQVKRKIENLFSDKKKNKINYINRQLFLIEFKKETAITQEGAYGEFKERLKKKENLFKDSLMNKDKGEHKDKGKHIDKEKCKDKFKDK